MFTKNSFGIMIGYSFLSVVSLNFLDSSDDVVEAKSNDCFAEF